MFSAMTDISQQILVLDVKLMRKISTCAQNLKKEERIDPHGVPINGVGLRETAQMLNHQQCSQVQDISTRTHSADHQTHSRRNRLVETMVLLNQETVVALVLHFWNMACQ
jgi:hypothetical protein